MRIKKGDFIILLFVLFAAFGWFLQDYIWPEAENKAAIIEIDGQFFKKISLNNPAKEELELKLEENKHLHIVSENNGIQITESTCPNQVCVNTGIITKTGQNIVCLPYKVVIYIEGEDNNNIDDLSY